MFKNLQIIRPIKVAIKSNNRHQEEHVMSPEMRKAMQDGIQRKLCPRKQYNKPLLKLNKESKAEINEIKNKIYQCKQNISKMEWKKSQLGTSTDEIKYLNNQIEVALYSIFKFQAKIRDIKIQQYKKQLSTANLDKIV